MVPRVHARSRPFAHGAWLLALALFAALTVASPAAARETISGAEMVKRGHSWFEADVQYSQTGTFTNRYGTYRRDCSGYISMAWGMSKSYTTSSLVTKARAVTKQGLRPGDMLWSSAHAVLFVRWDTNDDGRRRYARIWHMANPENDMVSEHNADLKAGWLANFKPYRFIYSTE
jgi:hypothetical protein